MEVRSLERKLKLKPEGNGWLFRSVVAKLHKLISINELQSQMAKMGIVDIMIRAMGGRSVILTCNNEEERDEVIKLDCLQRWFSEVKPWEGQAACIERFVWLCCYGVPLNGWSNSSFKAIGELWGTFISTDEPTLRLTSFAEAKILVATSEFKEIDEWINVEIEGKWYRVKVLEEPSDQPSVAEKLIHMAVPDSSSPLLEDDEDDDDDNELDEHVVDTDEGNEMDGEEKGGNNDNVSMGDRNVNFIGDRVELPIQTREESMDPTESWDSKSMDSRNGWANVKEYIVSTQNGVTTDTLGTTSEGLNSQQLLQDNGQPKGINLMVDLNIPQGRTEGLSGSLERGEMEVQSKNSSVREVNLGLGCISQREEFVISNGDVEEVEGLHRQNSKDGSNVPGDKASFDAILKMRSRVRRSERKIKKKKHLAVIEAKFDKVNRTNKKGLYSSLFFKEARKMLDMAPILGIEVKGGRNYNLKRFVQMQEEELKERIHALDDFEEEDISEDDVDFKDDASLSLAF